MEVSQHGGGGLTGHLSLFQGSKGDPGMTGPTGAAGLPVSLQELEHPVSPLSSQLEAGSKRTSQILEPIRVAEGEAAQN